MTTPNFIGNEAVFNGIDPQYRVIVNGQCLNNGFAAFMAVINSSESMKNMTTQFAASGGTFKDFGTSGLSVGGQYNPENNTIQIPNSYLTTGSVINAFDDYIHVLSHELTHANNKPIVAAQYIQANSNYNASARTTNDKNIYLNRLINISIDEEIDAYIAEYNARKLAGASNQTLKRYFDKYYDALVAAADPTTGLLDPDGFNAYSAMKGFVVNTTPGQTGSTYLNNNSTHYVTALIANGVITSNDVVSIPGVTAEGLVAGGFQGTVRLADSSAASGYVTLTVQVFDDGSKLVTTAIDNKTITQGYDSAGSLENTVTKIDTNGDGVTDGITIGVDKNNDGLISAGEIFSTSGTKFDVSKDEYSIISAYLNGQITKAQRDDFIAINTANMVGSATSGQVVSVGGGGVSTDPIGAFYESSSPANDLALSIAAKTPVILDAGASSGQNGVGPLTAAQLAAKDANGDGKLSGAELNNLKVWVDNGEDGIANTSGTTELTPLSSYLAAQGFSSIRSTDYAFYTKGNARFIDSLQEVANDLAYKLVA
jgi:EF hand